MEHRQTHSQRAALVRKVVAGVIEEAVKLTNRSPRQVGELLLELGFPGKRNGEPYSNGAVRNWMNQVDRPTAEVMVALALHHNINLDEHLRGAGLGAQVTGLGTEVADLRNEIADLRTKVERHGEALRVIASSAQIE